jgi:hypothetical protein
MANPTVLQAAQRLTALTLVPGTLNVRLPQPFDGALTGYLITGCEFQIPQNARRLINV